MDMHRHHRRASLQQAYRFMRTRRSLRRADGSRRNLKWYITRRQGSSRYGSWVIKLRRYKCARIVLARLPISRRAAGEEGGQQRGSARCHRRHCRRQELQGIARRHHLNRHLHHRQGRIRQCAVKWTERRMRPHMPQRIHQARSSPYANRLMSRCLTAQEPARSR